MWNYWNKSKQWTPNGYQMLCSIFTGYRGTGISPPPTFSTFFAFFHLSSRGIRFRFLFCIGGRSILTRYFRVFFHLVWSVLMAVKFTAIHGKKVQGQIRICALYSPVFLCSFNCLYSSNIEKQWNFIRYAKAIIEGNDNRIMSISFYIILFLYTMSLQDMSYGSPQLLILCWYGQHLTLNTQSSSNEKFMKFTVFLCGLSDES